MNLNGNLHLHLQHKNLPDYSYSVSVVQGLDYVIPLGLVLMRNRAQRGSRMCFVKQKFPRGCNPGVIQGVSDDIIM